MIEERMNEVLNAARTQARRLAQAELERSTPPLHAWRPRHRRWLGVGAAFAGLGLVLASASWAWVRRDRPRTPVVAMSKISLASDVPSVAKPATRTSAEALRVAKRKRVVRAASPEPVLPEAAVPEKAEPEKADIELEGPDDEVILGRVPVKQAPLFTTEEYKARGVMVR